MRKTIATLLALAALGASAQSAAAVPVGDNPNATFVTYEEDESSGNYQGCTTPWSVGVPGQFGAWGNYVAGCTSRQTCRAVHYCDVMGQSQIETVLGNRPRVTMNTRMRKFHGGAVVGWRDLSCTGAVWCSAYDYTGYRLLPGEEASVQCNGVQQSAVAGAARVKCEVLVRYR
jgi:hypothetical protein